MLVELLGVAHEALVRVGPRVVELERGRIALHRCVELPLERLLPPRQLLVVVRPLFIATGLDCAG